ncbi:hypothetical protein PYCC9005_001733 [Savitreella phatthalungensis]
MSSTVNSSRASLRSLSTDSGIDSDIDGPTGQILHGPLNKINHVGLNGLRIGGTSGLDTGRFTASAVVEMKYHIEETDDILNPRNYSLLSSIDPDVYPPALKPHLGEESPGEGNLRRFIIVDVNVDKIYGARMRSYFAYHKVDALFHVLESSEEGKCAEQVMGVCEALKKFGIDRRRDPILSFGGGVVLDVSALAANLWRRNTPIIKIPTTLLANVDAAVGVKTAVNFCCEKNKIGTYCAPLAVYIDSDTFLSTLPPRHVANGMGEILKMALIKDLALFEHLEEDGSRCTKRVLRRSIQGMLEELEPNFMETTLYRIVDFGHTFSPMLEMASLESKYPLLHGEAVNIDMMLCMYISEELALISSEDVERVMRVVKSLGLPIWHDSFTLDMIESSKVDITKSRGGRLRLPVVSGEIGSFVFLDSVQDVVMSRAFTKLERAGRSTVNGYLA